MVDRATKELRRVREREIELKRLNGELACHECRRTRSACDKKVPCTACVDRGYPELCPLGTILISKYEKPRRPEAIELEEADHDERLDKLQSMHNRISTLEDALQLQTGGRHPLLADSLLRIKRGGDIFQASRESSYPKDVDFLINSFGTLSVGNAATHYIGPGSIEISVREEKHAHRVARQGLDFFGSSLPDDLVQASSFFPFVPACFSGPSSHAKLLYHLPIYARATMLVEAYFTDLAWHTTCIDREQVCDELLPMFYPDCRPLDPSFFYEEHLHALGLLFVVLALGAVLDSTQNFPNEEAEDFEKLARCALGMRSVVEHGSLEGCQATVLLGSYESLSDRKKSDQSSNSLIVWGLHIGLSIGLHLDPRRWNLETCIAERRRWVFWQLNCFDKLRSSSNKYPPIFEGYAIDCQFPEDKLAVKTKCGRIVESIWRWRHRFVRDSLTPLCELLSEARPIRYTKILELGARLEAQETHPFATMSPREQAALLIEPTVFRGYELQVANHPISSVWCKQLSIQQLHRICFARAIIENPSNPYESLYAPSFVATFNSTRILLEIVIRYCDPSQVSFRRLHKGWSAAVAGGIIIGMIACHVKVQPCRDEAHNLLEQLVTLFERASELPVPGENLSTLKDLLSRSRAAFTADTPQSMQLDRRKSSAVHVYKDADSELLMLSGHNARIISHGNSTQEAPMPILDCDSQSLPLSSHASPASGFSQSQSQSPEDPLVWLTDHEEDEANTKVSHR